MKIIFNFLPIKSGGGQQVAYNFVKVLKVTEFNLKDAFFLVTEGTYIHHMVRDLGFPNVLAIGIKPWSRFKFEIFEFKRWANSIKADVVFTMFGPNLPNIGLPSVVGCAYSNLFFPEIDFWRSKSIFDKLKLKFIDNFRLKRTLSASGIIFENSAMLNRAVKLFNYPIENAIFIPPSISMVDSFIEYDFGFPRNCIKVLYLANWHRNKNIEIIPDILFECFRRGVKNIVFIVSVDEMHPQSISFLERAKDLGVLDNIKCIGVVPPESIPSLYKQIDFVILLSLLESFSNNIIEAWVYRRPLIISNLEWATSICKNAALYVERLNATDICDKLLLLKGDLLLQKKLVDNGVNELRSYPNPKEKVIHQLRFVKKIFDNG